MTELFDRIRAVTGRVSATVIGGTVSAIWLLLVLLFWLLGPTPDAPASGMVRLGAFVGIVLPLFLVWMAVGLARSIDALRAEADTLHEALTQMRGTVPGVQTRARGPQEPAAVVVPEPLPAPLPRHRPVTPLAPAAPPARTASAADTRQSALRFDAPESVTVDPDDLIQALNFPDGPDDRTGIAALRHALQDHDAARVLRSAQDVVTLLAGGDVYMDNLVAGPVDLNAWRRFGEGVRGAAISGMGTMQDEAALETVTAMIKGDEIFRDTAHHFLRHFDLGLMRWLPNLSDTQVEELARTRSALAFMLLGRVAGLFG